MKRTLLPVLFAALCLMAASCGPSGTVKTSDLVGKWETGSGASTESYSFTAIKGEKNRFVSYRAGKISGSGTWEVKEGKLTLVPLREKTRTIGGARIENGALVIKDENGSETKFGAAGGQIKEGPPEKEDRSAQPEPADFKIGSLRELMLTLRANSGIDFSEPRHAGFSWSISDGGEIPVRGLEMEAKIPVNGDFSVLNARASDVARCLYSSGFDNDAANTTEISIGAKKNGLVCVVALPWTGNSEPEGKFPLKVRCGYIR
ncbi:MAG TPA: hypothetical protein VMD02_04545 [Candidatus Omnitrophota bacterium]|nr:hypothetical protein [Candidatus Omnitrophota bacterium]